MDGLEWTASELGAAEQALDVATQNLAGASSDGFHRVVFSAYLTSHGIATAAMHDGAPGSLRRTGRDLDLAVEGQGRMRLCNGTTRASASCERTHDGSLQTEDGIRLVGMHGALRFPLQAQIEHDGSITQSGRLLDRIALTQPARLQKGVVEAANTDSLHAMIDVLEAQRHFETAQKTAQSLDSVAAKDATETGRAAQ